MKHKITTIKDAERLIRDWTESYLEQPTDETIRHAARALVSYVGGYGNEFDTEENSFDVDEALGLV